MASSALALGRAQFHRMQPAILLDVQENPNQVRTIIKSALVALGVLVTLATFATLPLTTALLYTAWIGALSFGIYTIFTRCCGARGAQRLQEMSPPSIPWHRRFSFFSPSRPAEPEYFGGPRERYRQESRWGLFQPRQPSREPTVQLGGGHFRSQSSEPNVRLGGGHFSSGGSESNVRLGGGHFQSSMDSARPQTRTVRRGQAVAAPAYGDPRPSAPPAPAVQTVPLGAAGQPRPPAPAAQPRPSAPPAPEEQTVPLYAGHFRPVEPAAPPSVPPTAPTTVPLGSRRHIRPPVGATGNVTLGSGRHI